MRGIACQLGGLGVMEATGTPYVLLKVPGEGTLTLEIGPGEATGLLLDAEGISPALPSPHDLLVRALSEGGIAPLRVEIFRWDEMGPGCRLILRTRLFRKTHWTIRPSDGMILSRRMDLPLFIFPPALESGLKTSLLQGGDPDEVFTLVPFPDAGSPTVH